MEKRFIVAGMGEILFDILPEGKQVGGAPVNFVFHAKTLGLKAYSISAVGHDTDGQDILEKLTNAGLSTEHIEQVDYPTGTAEVSLDSLGIPRFTITENVAWDHIQWTEELQQLASRADAVCFGSLAQRSMHTSESIRRFLRQTRDDCLKIFDINLRQQYYSRKIIDRSLQAANVLKLNDDELTVLQELLYLPSTSKEALRVLQERYELQYIALTRGGRGSVLMDGQTCCDCPGFPATVVDTVGAGDSYTAVLTYGFLHQLPLDWINQVANKVAAYVCSQAGATPLLSDSLIAELEQDLLTNFKDKNK
jgi:fructokinase